MTHAVELLSERGAAMLEEDACGQGGAHVWVHFASAVPSADAYAWGVHVTRTVQTITGIASESFPKQATVPVGGYGNWLQLPGRHHTRPHWSRLRRPGEEWATGADAARVLLEWPATPADVVPAADAWPVRAPVHVPQPFVRSEAPMERRVAGYLSRLPSLADGQGRNVTAFRLSAFVVKECGGTVQDAHTALHVWNGRNAQPVSDATLEQADANASRYGGRRAA